MKLLFCPDCGDLFNLTNVLKTCSCGKTKGKYINNHEAEVNGNGISLAIGNGSLEIAMFYIPKITKDWRETTDDLHAWNPTKLIAWVRPHTGPANSNTKINPNL